MSSKRLRMWALWCSIWLAVYALLFAYVVVAKHAVLVEILQVMVPIALAIPAAILAHGLNRRNSYLQALRDLWIRLVPAAQTAIQYTHLPQPSQADFARTEEALSTAIDMLRGVFANIPSAGNHAGLYPYENIKDIEKIVSWLGYGNNFRSADSPLARTCITRLWQEMHAAMLGEFDRDVPASPVSKYMNTGSNESLSDLLIGGSLTEGDLCRKRRASAPRAI